MKIVIAPDSYKESLTAEQVASAIHTGFHSILPHAEYCLLPIADGGEGTLKILGRQTNAIFTTQRVCGPRFEQVNANMAVTPYGNTAFIEMAEACGLHLVPVKERDPWQATSQGLGELIRAALDMNVKNIVIGIGGSATNDGGIGMASALGYRFYNASGALLRPDGNALAQVHTIDSQNRDPRLSLITITVAADVNNPLLGESGCSYVFGPQKGLDPSLCQKADRNMAHFYRIAESTLGRSVKDIPGAGAAGGMGAALMLFTGAQLRSGAELIFESIGLKTACADADILITGEGRMDGQTLSGKGPSGILRYATAKTRTIAICGSVGSDLAPLYQHGFDAIFPTIPALLPSETLFANAYHNVEQTARNVAALLAGKK
ncbi:glycerate kinase [Limnobaculum parvum]|uniref:Glycerate kinase n=1 Tax=Limnobaculum parvum TaxID=2172103 RepID=A0A2Y9TZ87_9GAMM|nr:glycerate kinase [Limnobaculum parvum]AWH88995.1 glycerate kinase [Limnobaculum parvum]